MKTFPILYWPRRTKDDADYQLARKTINNATGLMPEIITDDLDLGSLFAANPDATVYFPVFCESTGWWGELLGAGAVVTRNLADHALAFGNPARVKGWICACGEKLDKEMRCPSCFRSYTPMGPGLIERLQLVGKN